jgi:hypothetical protein
MKNVSDRSCRENQNNKFMFNFFFENRTIYEIMWKKIVDLGRPQMTIWRIACWIPTFINTHSEYEILIAFPLQKLLLESASMLRYTSIAGLVVISETERVYCGVRAEGLN